MSNVSLLREIGISESEAKIYLSLLRLGEATVVGINKHSGIHRTNIYDCLEKLKEKGLVSFLWKDNKQYFRPSDPENLLGYLKEKEEPIALLIPSLKEMQSKLREKVTVEVFKGKQGMKAALKDILMRKEKVIGYGVSGQFRSFLPEFSKYYFREQTKHKIQHWFIFTVRGNPPPSSYYKIRYLPKEFASATTPLCYSDTLLYLIWEPELVAIKIKCKELAENFKKHFKLLWKIAKP